MTKPQSAYCIRKCRELEQREIENICELFRICQRSQLGHQELQFGITPLAFVLPLVVDCLNQVVRQNGEESLLFLSSFHNA